jgi:tetratricopeptide (TPR) repeat protein
MDPLTAGAIASAGGKALATAVARRGLAVAVTWLSDPGWRRALARKAAEEIELPTAEEPTRRWLESEETKRLLVNSEVESNLEILKNTLAEELANEWAAIVDEPPEGIDFDQIAQAILASVLQNFLGQLDPAEAVNVADFRASIRHDELKEQIAKLDARLAKSGSVEDALLLLPTTVRPHIRALIAQDLARAQALLGVISEASIPPDQALQQLVRGPAPTMFSDASATFWLALADLCAAYGVREGEIRGLDEAALAGAPNRAHVYARVAMSYAGSGDRETAAARLNSARELSPMDPLIELVDAALAEDNERMVAAAERLTPFVDGIGVAILRALGLVQLRRLDDALAVLEAATAEYPEWTSALVWKANLLLSKAEQIQQGDVRRRLSLQAFELARTARDLRRKWRGLSGECVEVMTRAAVTLGDRRLALQVCLPENEANAVEATSPEVLEIAVVVLLDAGQTERAAQLCELIDSPYHQLLARGALAAETGNREEAKELLDQALLLARHEGERRNVIGHMATAGVWPLPDFEKIRDRDAPDAAILEAASCLARGNPGRAIEVLRPIRRYSSRVARMLATAYEDDGQLDNAVGELQDAARYFRDPELSAHAALTLADAGKMDQAVNMALRAATELPIESVLLPRIRILLVNGLGSQRRWTEAEEQARRLLEIEPSNNKAGWALAVTLVQQSKLGEAWGVIVERRLEPVDEEQSRVWVALASRYQPAHEWAEKALSLTELYADSEILHALVLISFTRHPDPDLPPTIGARITDTWSQFLKKFPSSDILRPQAIGEADAEIVEALRRILEPGAQAALDQARAVQDGQLPLGVLATGASRSYVEAWIGGGTGTLPIYIPVQAVNDQETAAAGLALNQEIVVDGSSLAVLSLIPDQAPTLLAAFTRILLPTSLRQDAVRAFDSFVTPSAGVLGWDPERSQPTMTQIAPEVAEAHRKRAEWIEAETVKADAVDVSEFPDLPGADPNIWWWLGSLQLAKSRGVALYCDDAWIRRVAASIGIRTFGTVDLTGILTSTGRVSIADARQVEQRLRSERAVSIPISRDELIGLAGSEAWGDGLACLQICQAGFWSLTDAPGTYDNIVLLASRHNAQSLPIWVAAGALGATRVAPIPLRVGIIASFFAAAIASYGQPGSVPDLVEAARAVAKRVQAGDPLPHMAPILRDLLSARLGPRGSAIAITTLTEQLGAADRHTLSLAFFAPGSTA